MSLTFEQFKPFLSERGQLEVELASLRAIVQAQSQMIEAEKVRSTDG